MFDFLKYILKIIIRPKNKVLLYIFDSRKLVKVLFLAALTSWSDFFCKQHKLLSIGTKKG